MTFPQLNSESIIDSHCHLDLLEAQGENIDAIIENARLNNVNLLQTICTRISKFNDLQKYLDKYPNVYASLGTHPCNVHEEPPIKASQIIELCAQNKKIIGLGETGLDYYHQPIEKNLQKASFLEHIHASQINALPVIIHARNADLDMIEILQSEQKNKKFPAILHCFSSSQALAHKALDLDVKISISGIITFKNAIELQQIVKSLPLESLLVETDSPYLAPTPHRGARNQPAFTRHVVEFIAQLKNSTAQEVAQATTQNFLQMFKL